MAVAVADREDTVPSGVAGQAVVRSFVTFITPVNLRVFMDTKLADGFVRQSTVNVPHTAPTLEAA